MLPEINVLLIDLEEDLSIEIKRDLKKIGYRGVTSCKVRDALEDVKQKNPRMIILDRHRTGELGLEFCRQVRSMESQALILMLLPKETVEERVACLDSGCDDYFLLPYHAKDFLNLVQFYLRTDMIQQEQIVFASLTLDLSTRCLLINNKEISLTMKEFELLKYLMSHPGEVVTRNQILDSVWGFDFIGESNVIEVYIRYLRLKLEAEGEKRIIQTVRGVGYVMREG